MFIFLQLKFTSLQDPRMDGEGKAPMGEQGSEPTNNNAKREIRHLIAS